MAFQHFPSYPYVKACRILHFKLVLEATVENSAAGKSQVVTSATTEARTKTTDIGRIVIFVALQTAMLHF